MKLLPMVCSFALTWTALQNVAADSLVPNGGFEDGITGWGVFIPTESEGKNCRFDVVSNSPDSGVNCARFQSDDFARFSIGAPAIPVQPGERYHVSVWIRADPAALVRLKTPGFVIRLFLGLGKADAEGGHLFIGPGNRVARGTPAEPVETTLPTSWTQIEAVVEIPPGVDSMGPALFVWWTQGSVFADDFTVEKVDASTALTPLWQSGATPSPTPTPASPGDKP